MPIPGKISAANCTGIAAYLAARQSFCHRGQLGFLAHIAFAPSVGFAQFAPMFEAMPPNACCDLRNWDPAIRR